LVLKQNTHTCFK